jgi:hypothetical protein
MTPIELYETLTAFYGRPHRWPAVTPYKVIAGAILTQNMHIGSYDYDTESAAIKTLTAFIQESCCKTDISDIRRHYEVYLGDPCKTAPKKLETVIRHSITRKL